MSRTTITVALLVISAACSNPAAVTTPITEPVPSTWPAASGPSRTFSFAGPAGYQVSDYTVRSNFVLYDTGAFVLNYPSGSYRGRYIGSNEAVAFEWQGGSAGGPWAATGVFNGDLLTIRFNIIMSLSDFEDAVYTLVR